MLEQADLGRRLEKDEYQQVFPRLQERLRQLQYLLREAEIPTVVLVEGWDAAGKGTLIRRLAERLDPRAFRAHPATPPSDLEKRYHWLWRYQVRLPADGHIALFEGSWYERVLGDRVEKRVKKHAWRGAYEQINQLERWLIDDGQVVVKLFFHVTRGEQKRRLRQMEEDPTEEWKVDEADWRQNRRYEKWLPAIEEMLERTHTEACPWTVVAATDRRFTRVQVFETLVARMEEALARREHAPADVSRTQRARAATRDERHRRRDEDHAHLVDVAREAGLPLEDEA